MNLIQDQLIQWEMISNLKDKLIEVSRMSKLFGFRIATANPEKINSFIVQNGNAYDEGLGEFWNPIKDWWYNKTAENKEKIRQSLTLNVTKWQYTHGTRNPEAIDSSNWKNDQAILDSPGNSEIQLAMLYDYRTNVQLYPQWQQLLSGVSTSNVNCMGC